ncbi:MAG: type II toxin-antitoxin system VapC family toxin [Micromonosporaceae bacterium]
MIYLDSSAIIKLALEETESAALRSYLESRDELPQLTSDLAMVEVPRAVSRSQPLGLTAAYAALQRMEKVPISPSVLMSAASLPPLTLRSLDAIHLSSALAYYRDLTAFVTYDKKLLEAATFHDLPVASPS